MRKLVLVLVVMMLTSLLAAPAYAQTDIAVAIWGSDTRTERTTAALSLYEKENSGVKTELRPFAWSDYWSMMESGAFVRHLPDVIQMDYQYLNQYVNSGLLMDLTPFVSSGALTLSDVNDSIVESGMVNGGLYAVSLGVNAPALLYNKTLLDSVGLTVADNMTMDDFIILCREVYDKTGYKTNIGFGTDMLLGYYLRGLGTDLFSGGQLAASIEQITQFFSLYEQGIQEGWHLGSEVFSEISLGTVEQDPIVYGSDPSLKSWCAFFWSNQMTALAAVADPLGMEIGITTWPSPNVRLSNYLKPSQFFSVSADSLNPDVAVSVIDFFTNSVPCNEILLGERGIPASAAVATAISPQLNWANQSVVSYINDVVSPNCSTVPAADPVSATEFYALVDDLTKDLCYGKITAEDAAITLISEAPLILR